MQHQSSRPVTFSKLIVVGAAAPAALLLLDVYR
jgi:hypothetical protein